MGLGAETCSSGSAAEAQSGEVQLLQSELKDVADPQQVAAEGVRQGGQELPFLAQIQKSFGAHPIQKVQAHFGSQAQAATNELGAHAYARGDSVAFGSQPDLWTTAHEAAHVVQQRAGVSLPGGMSQAGDRYERQADAVANRVIAGRSAESLLGPVGVEGAGLAVQCAHKYAGKTVTDILKLKKASVKNAPLESGSPSWDDIQAMTWEQIDSNARARRTGFKTFRKLLTDGRFDK